MLIANGLGVFAGAMSGAALLGAILLWAYGLWWLGIALATTARYLPNGPRSISAGGDIPSRSEFYAVATLRLAAVVHLPGDRHLWRSSGRRAVGDLDRGCHQNLFRGC